MKKSVFTVSVFHSEKLTSSIQQAHEVTHYVFTVYTGKLRCRDLANMPKGIKLIKLVTKDPVMSLHSQLIPCL